MAIDTLDELKYYCNEKEPSGALMLIGEWGCGKTYLIDHALSEGLKGTHIIIRISYFDKVTGAQEDMTLRISVDNVVTKDDANLQQIAKSRYIGGPGKELHRAV